MKTVINSTLAAKYSLHSDKQLAKADDLALNVKIKLNRLYFKIKWELFNKKSNITQKKNRIKYLLMKVIYTANELMHTGLSSIATSSHNDSIKILSKTIPFGYLSLISELKPVTAAVVEALTPKQAEQIKDAVFEPMTDEQITKITKGTTKGVSWQARMAQQTSLAPPEHLASLIATGYAMGENPASLAAKIKPFVDGVASTARRVARNESMRIAHESRMESYEELGDMIVGYQIHATMDARVRPHHAARSGTIYYKKPAKGQLGLDKMPRPPMEEDGSVAHNCRCWITPVLDVQTQIEEDPAAKTMFADASGKLVPNPAVYTDWFKSASVLDQKRVVGAKRMAAVQARKGYGAQINWSDFVNPISGKLLDVAELTNETEEEAKKRIAVFRGMITKRKTLTQQIYTYGYIPPSQNKTINPEAPIAPLNPIAAIPSESPLLTKPNTTDQVEPVVKSNLNTLKPPVTKLDLLFVDFKIHIHKSVALAKFSSGQIISDSFPDLVITAMIANYPASYTLLNFSSPAAFNISPIANNYSGAGTYKDIITAEIMPYKIIVQNTKDYFNVLPKDKQEPLKLPATAADIPDAKALTELFDKAWKLLPLRFRPTKNIELGGAIRKVFEISQTLNSWLSGQSISSNVWYKGKKMAMLISELVSRGITNQPDYKVFPELTVSKLSKALTDTTYNEAVNDMIAPEDYALSAFFDTTLERMKKLNDEVFLTDFNAPTSWDSSITYKAYISDLVTNRKGMKKNYDGTSAGYTYTARNPLTGKSDEQLDKERAAMNCPVLFKDYLEAFPVKKENADYFYGTDKGSDNSLFFRYIGGNYQDINDNLRRVAKGEKPTPLRYGTLQDTPENVEQFNKDIYERGDVLPVGMILYRGGYNLGVGIHIDPAFISTSISYSAAGSFKGTAVNSDESVIYTIIVSEPVPCLPVRPIVEYQFKNTKKQIHTTGLNEHEFILPLKCKIIVTGKVYPDGSLEALLYAP